MKTTLSPIERRRQIQKLKHIVEARWRHIGPVHHPLQELIARQFLLQRFFAWASYVNRAAGIKGDEVE